MTTTTTIHSDTMKQALLELSDTGSGPTDVNICPGCWESMVEFLDGTLPGNAAVHVLMGFAWGVRAQQMAIAESN